MLRREGEAGDNAPHRHLLRHPQPGPGHVPGGRPSRTRRYGPILLSVSHLSPALGCFCPLDKTCKHARQILKACFLVQLPKEPLSGPDIRSSKLKDERLLLVFTMLLILPIESMLLHHRVGIKHGPHCRNGEDRVHQGTALCTQELDHHDHVLHGQCIGIYQYIGIGNAGTNEYHTLLRCVSAACLQAG